MLADLKPPELLYFDLDLTSDMLTLYYSEQVQISSLIINYIELFSAINETNRSSFQLTNATYVSISPNMSVIEIGLANEDLYVIKNITNLATSMHNTFLSLQRGSIVDLIGNEAVSIALQNPIQVLVIFTSILRFLLLAMT